MAKKYNPLVKMGFETVSQGGGGGLVELTYAQALAAMQGSSLTPGTLYKITDRGDRGLFFTAISTNKFAVTGTRLMLCPANYSVEVDAYNNSWIGVWYSGLTTVVNDLAIWGGKVWKNLTGEVGTSESDTALDVTNWVEITKIEFSNNEYVELVFGVEFDWENDWICKQWDDRGNVFGIDYSTENDEDWGLGFGFNLSDVSDWNNNKIFNNKCFGVYNNRNEGTINSNSNTGVIASNSNTGDICYNSNSGDICYNSNLGNIDYNSNSDWIGYNSNSEGIRRNRNNGSIESNSNSGNISDNSNEGYIASNIGGSIENNSNKGVISGNSCSQILYNSNKGVISNNTNSGTIVLNSNEGQITGNSNYDDGDPGFGSILRNRNSGDINGNSNNGDISNNSNSGYIINCSGESVSIKNNGTSTGNIGGAWVSDVEDTITDKTGS